MSVSMTGPKLIKYFWIGTEDELYKSCIRLQEPFDYILDQGPVWVDRASQESWWETRHGLLTLASCVHSGELYEDYLSGMMIPKKYLRVLEKRNVAKYGNDRLRSGYCED